MRLTCPTCRSELEVPDGTTALVRCPTCRQVFEPAAGLVRVEPERPRRPPPEEERPRRRPEPAPRRRHEEDEEAEPERPRHREREEPEPKSEFLREKEARAAAVSAGHRRLKREFRRAGIGCNILRWSFLLYSISILLQMVFLISAALMNGGVFILLLVAGVLAAINWVAATLGVAVLITGPDRESMRGYAAAALAAGVLHLGLLGIALSKSNQADDFGDRRTDRAVVLADIPTQYSSLASYLTWIVYRDQAAVPAQGGALLVLVGMAELVRLLLTVLALTSLARAGGDSELAYQCIRAGAVVLFVLGGLVLGILVGIVLIWETGFINTNFGKYVVFTLWASMRLALAGVLLIPARRAADVAELCDAPVLIDDRYK